MEDGKIYKIGNSTIDLDKYLVTMNSNANNYIDYMGNDWSETEKANFKTVLNFLNANKNKISWDLYGNLKLDEFGNSASIPENTLNYLKIIYDATLEDAKLYDPKKHSFGAYLKDVYNNDFSTFYNSEYNTRNLRLLELGKNYFTWLKDNNIPITIDENEFLKSINFINSNDDESYTYRADYIDNDLFGKLSAKLTEANLKLQENEDNVFLSKNNFRDINIDPIDESTFNMYVDFFKEPSNDSSLNLFYSLGAATRDATTDAIKKELINMIQASLFNTNAFKALSQLYLYGTDNKPFEFNLGNRKLQYSIEKQDNKYVVKFKVIHLKEGGILKFLTGGLNDAFKRATVESGGATKDNSTDNYTPDGYWGALTHLRHLGNDISTELLNEYNKILNGNNLEAYIDILDKMVKFRTLNGATKEVIKTNKEGSTNTFKTEELKEENAKIEKIKALKNYADFINLAPIRFTDANITNRRMLDLANLETPLLKPFVDYLAIVLEDLRGMEQANKLAGEAQLQADLNMGADSARNTAAKLTATKLGNLAKMQAKLYNDEFTMSRIDRANLVANQNRERWFNTAWENAKSIYQTDANKRMYELAYLNKLHANRDLFSKELQQTIGNILQNTYDYKKKYTVQAITLAILANPMKFDSSITRTGLDIYLKGLKYGRDKLNTNEQIIYDHTLSKVLATLYKNLSNLEGIDLDKYWKLSITAKEPFTTLYKNGGKLKERIANADRFYKAIKDSLDRSEKALDRLFKCLYNVKNKK